MRIIYTAIFGQYEDLKEPQVITPGWKYWCFTDQPFVSNTWKIIHTPLIDDDPVRTARHYKIMYHRHIAADESMWVDGSFLINFNLSDFWDQHFQSPFSVPRHPIRNCVYEEILTCIQNKRGRLSDLLAQSERYRKAGIPAGNGLIQSGLLMRDNSLAVNKFCEYWWREVKSSSTRDQVAFALIAFGQPIHHSFEWDYRSAEEFIYTKHFKYRK